MKTMNSRSDEINDRLSREESAATKADFRFHPVQATQAGGDADALTCDSNQPSPLSANDGEILHIDYYYFAPEFAWGYCDFFYNDELEVNVKAQLTLIGYAIDEITSVMKSNLG